MKVTYFATRDSETARTDEDSAMAHADIYRGASLDDARAALHAYMLREANWLTTSYVTPRSLRRAADILEAAERVPALNPADDTNWSVDKVTPCGLSFAITRSAVSE